MFFLMRTIQKPPYSAAVLQRVEASAKLTYFITAVFLEVSNGTAVIREIRNNSETRNTETVIAFSG